MKSDAHYLHILAKHVSDIPTPIDIIHRLRDAMAPLRFGPPVTHVYNPLVYAGGMYDAYLSRFGLETPREVMLVGMNPGPWGMAQTGVPFGEVGFVRDWMGLMPPVDMPIGKPAREHPKRVVEGLECGRSEVSGSRVWGWAQARWGAAENFFERFFIHNYCPLIFLEESGRNRTPNRLKKAERDALFEPCDRALAEMVDYYQPTYLLGIGNFAQKRIKSALKYRDKGAPTPILGRILHPSPASPKANRGWAKQAEAELAEVGVIL